MSPPALQFEDVCFAYNGAPVLEGVSFSLPAGALLGVLGPNGAGKTTLARLAMGRLTPTSGRVLVAGRDPRKAAGRIGYVPQFMTLTQGFPVKVVDLVALGALPAGLAGWLKGGDAAGRRRRALEALEAVELADLADRPVAELSGGQRQRVLIARALVGDPELLILDEPTANIDPAGKSCIVDLLDGLAERRTVVLISHDLTVTVPHITAVAAVNRRVLFRPEPRLDQEMLELIYGLHRHDCPMDSFIHHLVERQPTLGRRHGDSAGA
ncbi:metal ABC transporter ATP-binding protein [Roseospirillum parvum]|uniref:Zinc transport system ATP-binding protein n=1 Tax=Roseospirillum parvum TaxID=83401 RepID=A0A1G7ZKB9_9PROT|nr:ABC transporter ATP-binding protein [Roseospirillum parvum]SDH09128.1 zinc transport system ATP-binding protein [Roseospirillum parvum]